MQAASLVQTADYFTCEIVETPERGVWLRPTPYADERFVQRAREAARKNTRSDAPRTWGTTLGAFRADTPEGLHALRTAARANLLTPRRRGKPRLDEEGIGRIDTEAASHPRWKAFLRTLNFRQKTQLEVWRGGALWTPTRRYTLVRDQSQDTSQLRSSHPPPRARGNRVAWDAAMACAYCGYHRASARHFMTMCPAFKAVRDRQARAIDPGALGDFFCSLPNCTVKTGWITVDAHPNFETRVEMQVAIAELGLDILFSPEETLRDLPHWTITQAEKEIHLKLDAAPVPLPPRYSHPPIATDGTNNE